MAERRAAEYSADVLEYLHRIYDHKRQRFACQAGSAEGVKAWQQEARPALRTLIGLEAIRASVQGHQATVELSEPEALEGYTRQLGTLHSEPSVSISFWLLHPGGAGPYPLGVFPQKKRSRNWRANSWTCARSRGISAAVSGTTTWTSGWGVSTC